MMYVLLLRGINVGGNNRVSMTDLKQWLEEIDYQTVSTIGNTGVAFFETNEPVHHEQLQRYLSEKAMFSLEALTILMEDITNLSRQLPIWWQKDSSWRYNVIFLLNDVKAQEVMTEISEIDPSIEHIEVIHNTIFWGSAYSVRELYRKSQYAQLLNHRYYKSFTIRNANTFDKIINQANKTI